jgi:hypothetical protein
MQESLPVEVQGLGVGVLLLCCTLVGELAPVIIAQQDPGDASGLAPVLFWNVAVAYALSGAVFLCLAGSVARVSTDTADRHVNLLSPDTADMGTVRGQNEVTSPP